MENVQEKGGKPKCKLKLKEESKCRKNRNIAIKGA
jgi:hypothetical protein